MKVIVVGNGPMSNLGEKIDSFDLVIRCNFFKIKGFEKDVGTKTDIWACGGIRVYKHSDCPVIWNAYSSEDYPGEIIMTKAKVGKRLKLTNPRWTKEVNEQIGMKGNGMPRATVGLVALNIALNEYGSIYFAGIADNPTKRHYYWDSKLHTLPKNDHDWEKEFKWVQEKEKSGVLVRIK